MLDPDPNPVPVLLRQNCGSGSTTLEGMNDYDGICYKCAYTRMHNDCANQNSSAKTVLFTVPLVEKKRKVSLLYSRKLSELSIKKL
jgi:hypothetical protein